MRRFPKVQHSNEKPLNQAQGTLALKPITLEAVEDYPLRFGSPLPTWAAFLLFCMAATFFVAQGPWNALHFYNSSDFASVYGAARSWLDRQNPYDMEVVTAQVRGAGDAPPKFSKAPPPPSVYLPTTLPVVATVAWLPWEPARLVWLLISASVAIWSFVMLLGLTNLTVSGKWLLAAAACFFHPVPWGLAHGNLSVLSCSLTILAVCLVMGRREGLAALTLGLAHCVKPQISIAAVALFALWGYWRPLLLSFVLPIAAMIVSVLRAPSIGDYMQWLASLQLALKTISSTGFMNDPSPANMLSYQFLNTAAITAIWIHSPSLANAAVFLIAGVLIVCYLILRRNATEDRPQRDMAFFSAVTLTLVYHRLYDGGLLVMMLPFLVAMAMRGKGRVSNAVLWLCMAVFLSPVAILAGHLLHYEGSPATPAGFLVLRYQPTVVLLICLLLVPWREGAKVADERVRSEMGSERVKISR